MDAVPKGSEKDLSNPAVQGVAYCDKLFVYERRLLVRKAVQRVVRIMYLHFGSRVQLTGEPKWGGERQPGVLLHSLLNLYWNTGPTTH